MGKKERVKVIWHSWWWNVLCVDKERHPWKSIGANIEVFVLYDDIYDPKYFINSMGGRQVMDCSLILVKWTFCPLRNNCNIVMSFWLKHKICTAPPPPVLSDGKSALVFSVNTLGPSNSELATETHCTGNSRSVVQWDTSLMETRQQAPPAWASAEPCGSRRHLWSGHKHLNQSGTCDACWRA